MSRVDLPDKERKRPAPVRGPVVASRKETVLVSTYETLDFFCALGLGPALGAVRVRLLGQ